MGTPFYFASVSPDIWIGDDGTLDTVVKFNRNGETETHRYDSEYRFSFSCLLYTSPSPRDRTRSRMPSSA